VADKPSEQGGSQCENNYCWKLFRSCNTPSKPHCPTLPRVRHAYTWHEKQLFKWSNWIWINEQMILKIKQMVKRILRLH
jgi:hypothetical protein